MANPEYLAACAEDTFLADMELAARIHERITVKGLTGQFSHTTAAKNAWEFVNYLKVRAQEKVAAPDIYLNDADAVELKTLREAEAAVGATEIEVSKRLHVGNLGPAAKAEDLRAVFDRAGLAVAAIVVPPRPSGNANRWFAMVDMKDGKSAMEAVDARDLSLAGRQLVISEAHSLPSQTSRSRTSRVPSMDITERLYIAGLPSTATDISVRVLFQNHGLNPVEVFLPKDRNSGQHRGFGFVSMASEAESAQAIGALNGSLVEGKALSVHPAEPRTGRRT
jgi:RNA recognition motif-containing protein